MTEPLFRDDAYQATATAVVTGHTPDGGVLVDRSVFYATSGGQPGDSGEIVWSGGRLAIGTAMKAGEGQIALMPTGTDVLPPLGAVLDQRIDWDRRFRHMRIHTALHLLSVVIPLPVTGGQIGTERGRLDFDMPEPPADLSALNARLNELIALDVPVTTEWITDAELEANPGLVKTMSVRPPIGQGRVRLVRIGTPDRRIDLQPCGGTHVSRTGEIGPVTLVKVENKGRQNRRVILALAD